MSFTHNETVSVRIVHVFRADIHLVKIQSHQNIHDTHVTADMTAFSFYDHIDNIFP